MTLAFNREFDPRYGEIVPVAPGVRRVTSPNPGPFTFAGTNTFLIGGDELAILDPGPADPGHIEAIVQGVGGGKVHSILVSHTHRDHSPGARLLQKRTGGTILAEGAHRTARPLRGTTDPGSLDASADLEFSPDRVLVDGELVEGSGFVLEAIATPGHTANHLAFGLLGTGLLFPGDHVMGWATTVVAPPDGSMADYMASLERLAARTEDRYLPAHGGVIDGARVYVRGLRAHRKMRERAVLQLLREGDRSIADMLPDIYAGLDARLLPAAALSTLAHLDDLVERGIVRTDGEPALTGRYWAAG